MSKNRIIKIFIVFYIPILIWCFYITVRFPYTGFNVKQVGDQWVIMEIEKKGLMEHSGLAEGDRILQINGGSVDSYPSVRRWGTVDQAQTIVALRDGKPYSLDLRSTPAMTPYDFTYLTIEFISLFIAIVLYKWMNASVSAKYLAGVFLNLSATFMGLGASIRGDPIGKIAIGMSIMLVPIVLLHFLIVFLKEKGNIDLPKGILKVSYLMILLMLIPHLSSLFIWGFAKRMHDFLAFSELLYFTAGTCSVLGFLIYVYAKYSKTSPYISIMLKSIGVSFTFSITPIVFCSFIPSMLFGREWVDSLYTSWMVIFFPLSFTYLLAAKKIYDIDFVIRRFILTASIAFLPSLFVVGMIAILFSSTAKIEHLVLAFMFVFGLFSIMLYSVEYFSTRLEKIIFPKRHYLQGTIRKIARKLGNISSFRELKDLILVDIIDILQVGGGAVVFKYNDVTETISQGEIDETLAERVVGGELDGDSPFTWFEITRNEDYSSYLVLTNKKTNTMLGSEEIHWLNLVVSYLSVSMENLFLIRKMSLKLEHLAAQHPDGTIGDYAWFRKLMFELQEKERIRIATDLHDTTMQDLFFLKRRVAQLSEQGSVSESSINGILEYIDIINMNLRQNCFELNPHLLQEVGLVGTIEKLVDMERVTAAFDIVFEVSGVSSIEGYDSETKRHLFRIVQELLNNAKKHSQASAIRIRLSATAMTGLSLSYEDNGVGFAEDRPEAREIGDGRMGLEQIKSRIYSMNGYVNIASELGQGMKFKAIVPIQEGQTA